MPNHDSPFALIKAVRFIMPKSRLQGCTFAPFIRRDLVVFFSEKDAKIRESRPRRIKVVLGEEN